MHQRYRLRLMPLKLPSRKRNHEVQFRILLKITESINVPLVTTSGLDRQISGKAYMLATTLVRPLTWWNLHYLGEFSGMPLVSGTHRLAELWSEPMPAPLMAIVSIMRLEDGRAVKWRSGRLLAHFARLEFDHEKRNTWIKESMN
jgi:hypothetical protein